MLIRLLRRRPFLWPVPLVIMGYVGGLWLEDGIAYDDGRLGALVFFTVLILGFAGILVINLLTMAVPSLHHATGATAALLAVVTVIAACLPYLIADRIATRWAASKETPVDPSPSLRSGSG